MGVLLRGFPYVLFVLLIFLGWGYVTTKRELHVMRVELEEARRERDAAQAAITQVLAQRDRAAATAKAFEQKQKEIREEVQRLKDRIKEIEDANARCVAAVSAIREEMRR